MIRSLLRLALTGALTGALLAGPRAYASPELVEARVTGAAGGAAFIAAGRQDGLREDVEIEIVRAGRVIARCMPDALSAHHARCPAPAARTGDRARFRRVAEAFESEDTSNAPAEPREAGPELRRRARTALAEASGPEVRDAARVVTGALAPRLEAALRHQSWIVADRRGYHRQTLTLAVRDLPLGFLDAVASLDLTVLTYAARPEDASFRPGEPAQLYVHETSVARRARGQDFVATLGRFRPWHAPGLTYLDGAQVGFRPRDDLELGVLGGAIPDLVRLEPHLDRWTAAVYGRWAPRAESLRLALEGRAGVVEGPELGTVGEAELAARAAWARRLAVTAAARFRLGADGLELPSARARIDVDPGDGLHFALDGRLRASGPDPYAPGLPVIGADHARAEALWEGLREVSLALAGTLSHLREQDLTRAGVGPEVGLPVLFGAVGGAWLGYQEAFGWVAGRTAWVQARLRPYDRLRLWLRASYREDALDSGPLRELGGLAQADIRVLRFFELRASLFGSLALTPPASAGPLDGGFTGRLSLVGRY